MTSFSNPQEMIGREVVDSNGDKLGKVGQVYLDDETGQPQWVTVKTGLFGSKESFAPLAGVSDRGGAIALTVDKELVKAAPKVEDDGHISDDEQQQLFDHYAGYMNRGGAGTGSGDVADRGGRQQVGRDVSGPTTDDAMTRSEERLRVGKEQVETGRARLRKYVVTENVTQTVPVQREEVRIEREPITEANRGAAMDGPAISEEEHEVTLHEERPVVQKEAVPVERVRLDTETVTEQRQVSEQVRKEEIDTDGVETPGGQGRSGTR